MTNTGGAVGSSKVSRRTRQGHQRSVSGGHATDETARFAAERSLQIRARPPA